MRTEKDGGRTEENTPHSNSPELQQLNDPHKSMGIMMRQCRQDQVLGIEYVHPVPRWRPQKFEYNQWATETRNLTGRRDWDLNSRWNGIKSEAYRNLLIRYSSVLRAAGSCMYPESSLRYEDTDLLTFSSSLGSIFSLSNSRLVWLKSVLL